METTLVRTLVKVSAALVLVFLYVPLVIVVLYAFNDSIGQAWPIQEYTTKWFSAAWNNAQVREALPNSLLVATVATLFALAIGSLAAFAVHRFRFFGRNSVSFLLVLPIALPGIVTGSLLVFIPTLGSFVVPDLLGGARHLLVGSLIQNQFGPARNWPFGSAGGFMVMGVVMVGLMGWVALRSRVEGRGSSTTA